MSNDLLAQLLMSGTDYLIVRIIHPITEIGTALLISVLNFDHSVLLLPHRQFPASIHSSPIAHGREAPTHLSRATFSPLLSMTHTPDAEASVSTEDRHCKPREEKSQPPTAKSFPSNTARPKLRTTTRARDWARALSADDSL